MTATATATTMTTTTTTTTTAEKSATVSTSTLAAADAADRTSEKTTAAADVEASTTTTTTTTEDEAAAYTRFTPARKAAITAIIAVSAVLPPLSATMVAAALPQVAADYATSGAVVNLSNATYLLAAGFSPCVAGPLSSLYGRRKVLVATSVLYVAFSLGTALAPNLGAYFAFRTLAALSATPFLSVGNTCIGDVFQPVERATAGGWVLLGFEMGPTVGPFIGGVLVTYRSWRTLFYFQAALGAFVFVLYVLALPETTTPTHRKAFEGLGSIAYVARLAKLVNPLRVIGLFRYPTVLAAGLGSGALSWNMYSLLVPISYLLNKRFSLQTTLQAGLFFLAPGAGYIFGALTGGRWADYVAVKAMRRKNGRRIPEDRLKACLPFIGVLGPISMLLYGWSVQYQFGGIPLPVITMFLQAVAQLFGYLTINPYCLDVMQSTGRAADVVAGNYFSRYMFGAVGTAVALPIIDSVGVGWLSTISAILLLASAVFIAAAAKWGPDWRGEKA